MAEAIPLVMYLNVHMGYFTSLKVKLAQRSVLSQIFDIPHIFLPSLLWLAIPDSI